MSTAPISYRAAAVVTGLGGTAGGRLGDVARWVTVDGEEIVEVGPDPPAGTRHLDLGDVALWPGLVDLHADTLGQFESPRPGVRVPLAVAVHDAVLDAVAHGITGTLLCVAVGEGPDPDQTLDRALAVVRALDEVAPALSVQPAVHLRVDVGSERAREHARLLLERHRPEIALVSAMDHTPGRRQYGDTTTWHHAMRVRTGATDEDLERWRSWLPADRAEADARRVDIGALAAEFAVPFASHDDDTCAAAVHSAVAGAVISEFPTSAGAAAGAHQAGLAVVMGAPNAWRGRSHLGALSARDALHNGHLHALTSDYHHAALLHAAHALPADGVCSLERSVELVTSAPARLIGTEPHGATLSAGQRADMIAVRGRPVPSVDTVWAAGRVVMSRPPPSSTILVGGGQ